VQLAASDASYTTGAVYGAAGGTGQPDACENPRSDRYNAKRAEAARAFDRMSSGLISARTTHTDWSSERDKVAASVAGCDRQLVKPVAIADLDRLLANITGAQQPTMREAIGLNEGIQSKAPDRVVVHRNTAVDLSLLMRHAA
jgi:hypothetical protein